MLLETTATAERTSRSVRAIGVLQSRKTMIFFWAQRNRRQDGIDKCAGEAVLFWGLGLHANETEKKTNTLEKKSAKWVR